MVAPLPLFDPNRLIQLRQRARRAGGDSHPLLAAMADDLLARLDGIRRPFHDILLVSDAPNRLRTGLLQARPGSRVTVAAFTPGAGGDLVVGEAALPFAPERFELIILDRLLHHINDVPGFLIQLRHALRPDGLLLASFFGGESLQELRIAMGEADLALLGGAAPHTAPVIDMRDAGMLLMRAGFALPAADRERFTLLYKGATALMHDLRLMGEGLSLTARLKRYLGKAYFSRVDAVYRERFGQETGEVRATFDVLTLAGWAPAANQQKPLVPGSATHDLAAALNSCQQGAGDTVRP